MATYQSKRPYAYGTGRRKSSTARVHLIPNGSGSITINGRTLDEIGAQLGVTRERVRQIQVRAERHLREMLKRRSSFALFAA